MIVVGGTYREVCRYPAWDHIYGSGLRAAMALSSVSPATEFHTFAPQEWFGDINATLDSVGLRRKLTPINKELTFGYLHPFEMLYEPKYEGQREKITVEGDVVLCFGMIEGDAIVSGNRVVYDPQNSGSFLSNGSKATELTIILKPDELHKISDRQVTASAIDDLHDQVSHLRDLRPEISVVIVRDVFGSICVYDGESPLKINNYAAESYFRIGAGDVLAAAYAYAWGEQKMSAFDAADYAARCVAFFVEGPRLPIPPLKDLGDRRAVVRRDGRIKISASGGLDVQSLLLHTMELVKLLGGNAVNDLFGFSTERQDVEAELVLIGSRPDIDELALISNMPTPPSGRIVYLPNKSLGITERYFPGAEITDDYATALYRAMRRVLP